MWGRWAKDIVPEVYKGERMKTIAILMFCLFILSCGQSNSLSGTFVNTETFRGLANDFGGVFENIEFRGPNSCIITMPFGGSLGQVAAGYVLSSDTVRITTPQGDLMFTIKDQNTLIGIGVAKGTYVKK